MRCVIRPPCLGTRFPPGGGKEVGTGSGFLSHRFLPGGGWGTRPSRALKRAEEIADDTLLLVKCRAFKARKPAGNKQPDKHAAGKKKVITKVYKGVEYRVYPDKGGCFLYDGTRYNTLSEVSTRIAGYYVSGTKFFGIRKSDIA